MREQLGTRMCTDQATGPMRATSLHVVYRSNRNRRRFLLHYT